jgi:uncharacterized repeat protein (TIGR04052 family)
MLATVSLLGLAACTSAPPANVASAPPGAQPVTLNFAAQVGGRPFACGRSYDGIGTTASTLTPTDFRLFVSEVHLLDETGRAVPVRLTQDGIWQFEDIALLDFEDGSGPCRNGTAATNLQVRGSVPAGRYTGLRFTLGVPFARNHGDPTIAPSPLNLTAMFWNWQGGYRFVKFDAASSGLPRTPAGPGAHGSHGSHGGGGASGFSVHLGSTVCASESRTQPASSCRNPNRVTVQFDRFDAGTQTVVADIAEVLASANVDVNAPKTPPGCMSFPNDGDCPPIMAALGLPYGERAAPGPQRLFKVR